MMRRKITPLTALLATLAVAFWLLFMIAVGGLVLLATLIGTAVTLISVPVLWLLGKRRGAGQLLVAWGIYAALYVAVSTGITVAKGLELYVFDERGRTFRQPANLNPLDVALPAGETVRQSMTFTVPADARELFLTAKYRAFTYQSLLPGELSLFPNRPAAMIRIQ